MSTTKTRTPAASGTDSVTLTRIAREGYSDEAWHGPSLKTALQDVTAKLAFWRPGSERHNIAEIALHHAYTVWSVRKQLAGPKGVVEPFVLPGEGWFDLPDQSTLGWPKILDAVSSQQAKLEEALRDLRDVAESRDTILGLALGLSCHAAYHAGQIQLIKKLK
jgi:hypothetical protein